jgi:hypothetical protein
MRYDLAMRVALANDPEASTDPVDVLLERLVEFVATEVVQRLEPFLASKT